MPSNALDRTARIEAARRALVGALVARGAERTYATGFVAERVRIDTLASDGQVMVYGAGRHASGEDPTQLTWMAHEIQRHDPSAPLSIPEPDATADPALLRQRMRGASYGI